MLFCSMPSTEENRVPFAAGSSVHFVSGGQNQGRLFTSFAEGKSRSHRVSSQAEKDKSKKCRCGLKTNSNKYRCLGKTDVLFLLTAVDEQRINFAGRIDA